MIFYLTIFIIGGLFGWLIDSSYRTWYEGKYSPNTWIPFFSPIYASATVLLYVFFTFSPNLFFFHVIVGSIIVIFLEMMSGIIAFKFLKKKFWDYSNNKYNFYGLIDAKHSFYWLLLVSLYRLIYPYLLFATN